MVKCGSEMQSEICLQSVWKIFGGAADEVIAQLRAGEDPAVLHQRSGARAAVQDVSLEIGRGEIFVVMGLSGSGKSTLLRMLNGLIAPCAGEVVVQGRALSSMTSAEVNAMRRRQMAMVFQSFALFPQRSVLENAAFGLEVAGVSRRERHDKALQALERVGLAQEARKRPRQLSGGMQQRVGLARALALDPPILLMDEAFSALDPLIRRDMQTLLLELQSEQQRTIVFISHDLDEAIRLGDRIALMQGGCLLQCDTADNLLHHPVSDAVRHFFRDVDVASVLAVEAIAQRPSRLAVIAADEALPEAVGEPLYVLGRDQAFRGVLSEARGWVSAERGPALTTGMRVREAIELVARTPYPPPVLDDAHRLVGVISPRLLLQSMEGDT